MSYQPPEIVKKNLVSQEDTDFENKSAVKVELPNGKILCINKITRGGHEESEEIEMNKLKKSILSKSNHDLEENSSINKILKKVLSRIEPVITDQNFLKILQTFEKSIEPTIALDLDNLSGLSKNISPAKNLNSKSDNPKKGSSIFVQGLVTPQTTRRHNLLLPMTPREDNFSNGLTPSGLSLNHKESAEDFQNLEKLTQDRRATPLLASQSLGEPYYYSEKQLRRKAPRHLTKDFNISIEGKTPEQQALAYYNVVEKLLKKSDLIVNKKATLNKQEKVEIRLDLKSRLFAAFENKPFYDKNCFISAYKIIPEAVQEFLETGNIGVSPEERKVLKDYDQKAKAAQERIQANKHSFYKNLPEDARIGNKQLSEAEIFKAQLETDPNFQLTDKQKSLLERAERHEHHKQKFYKKNPHISEDEL